VPSFTFPPDRSLSHLEELGPLLPVTITVPVRLKKYLEAHGFEAHPSRHGYALIDTGAALSAVDDRVIRELEIPILEQMDTTTPHGPGSSNVYNASASFSPIGKLDVPLEGVLGCYLGEPQEGEPEIIMLLGRDLLCNLVVVYDGPNARVTITS
jgi:hypothetical protein